MTLKEVLPERQVYIECRTHDVYGDDVLSGFCKWTGENLVAVGKTSYSIEDTISSYEWDGPNNLIIWYAPVTG